MRFKIDENLHGDAAELLRQHQHDAMTVYEEGLCGHPDGDLITFGFADSSQCAVIPAWKGCD